MAIFYSEKINKIKQNKEKLEKELKIKLSFSGKSVLIQGDPINIYAAERVFEAINLDFKIEDCLLLKDEEFVIETINIKDLTKRKDLERIRARIIGTKGKTKELIQNLSDCLISVHNNQIGIIGRTEDIKKAITAITSLIQGKKQGKVYGFLEKERSREKIKINEDLGLKKKKE